MIQLDTAVSTSTRLPTAAVRPATRTMLGSSVEYSIWKRCETLSRPG